MLWRLMMLPLLLLMLLLRRKRFQMMPLLLQRLQRPQPVEMQEHHSELVLSELQCSQSRPPAEVLGQRCELNLLDFQRPQRRQLVEIQEHLSELVLPELMSTSTKTEGMYGPTIVHAAWQPHSDAAEPPAGQSSHATP